MPTPSKTPTQKTVAQESGLSRTTVGAILCGGAVAERYSEETRRRVMEAAARLNYRPHRAAQAMRKQRSNLLAIVHFGAGIEAAHKSNLALSRKANAEGFDCLAVDMNWHGGSVERTLEELIQARVEGVLISHIQEVFQEEHIEALRQAGIPVVSVNGERRPHVPQICDNVSGAFEQLTRHLLNVGHRRILNLTATHAHQDKDRVRSLSQRVQGFRQAIEERGNWRVVMEDDFPALWSRKKKNATEVAGITIKQDSRLYDLIDQPVYKFCKCLFASGKLPDAIVCPNDMYAMEAIAAALECGLRVPEDLAVTGYDNDRIGAFPIFGITTAEQDIEGICTKAVETLIRRIADPNSEVRHRAFDSKILLRTSCGRMLKKAAMQ